MAIPSYKSAGINNIFPFMRENLMVRVLLVAFGLGAIFDFFLSIFGLAIILQSDSPLGYLTCVVIALILLCLRLCMKPLSNHNGVLYKVILRSLIFVAGMDCYAISTSVAAHVINKQPLGQPTPVIWKDLWATTAVPVIFVSAALVFFLTIAPMTLSYLLHEYFGEISENEDREEEEKDDAMTFTQAENSAKKI
jgi:hypothetical protein